MVGLMVMADVVTCNTASPAALGVAPKHRGTPQSGWVGSARTDTARSRYDLLTIERPVGFRVRRLGCSVLVRAGVACTLCSLSPRNGSSRVASFGGARCGSVPTEIRTGCCLVSVLIDRFPESGRYVALDLGARCEIAQFMTILGLSM